MRARTVLCGVLAAAVLLAGCGGDDDNTAAKSESTTTVKVTTPTSVVNPAAVAGALALAPAECRAALAAFATGPAAAFQGSANSTDFAQVETYLKKVQASAPSEIKDDLGLIVDFYAKFVQAVKDAGIDFSKPDTVTPDRLQKLQSVMGSIDQQKFQAASQNVDKYFQEHCKTS